MLLREPVEETFVRVRWQIPPLREDWKTAAGSSVCYCEFFNYFLQKSRGSVLSAKWAERDRLFGAREGRPEGAWPVGHLSGQRKASRSEDTRGLFLSFVGNATGNR